jgi:hypothetical protein
MRWLKILFAVFVLALLIMTAVFHRPARADNPVVTMTVSGWVLGSPILTVTWISDTEVRLDWLRSALLANAEVRMKIGEQPADHDDGYHVCSGNITTYTDTVIDLDQIINSVWYGLWIQDGEGNWSSLGSFGHVEGSGMIDISNSLNSLADNMMPFMVIAMMLPLGFFTWLTVKVDSDWGSPILAFVTGGISFFFGFNAPNFVAGPYETTPFGLVLAVALIIYSLLCIIWSWSMMFKSRWFK